MNEWAKERGREAPSAVFLRDEQSAYLRSYHILVFSNGWFSPDISHDHRMGLICQNMLSTERTAVRILGPDGGMV